MSFRIDKPHPFKVKEIVRVVTITNMAEETLPSRIDPTWEVTRVFWENGEPYCALALEGHPAGITRQVTARRCCLVSAVDRLGDVARD